MNRGAIPAFLLSLWAASSTAFDTELRGNIKSDLRSSSLPEQNLERPISGAQTHQASLSTRLIWQAWSGPWSLQLDYQLLGRWGDLNDAQLAEQDSRPLGLHTELRDHSRSRVMHELDRASLSYTGEQTVVRVGRQAVSWGNGLFFHILDVFNPFNPAAVDTEYKPGADMLYVQQLLDNGNDWQAVRVYRNDDNGSEHSTAVKYHHFGAEREWDFLVARHFGDELVGIGVVNNFGEAVWRTDLSLTRSGGDKRAAILSNLSYSWVWKDHNFNGSVEILLDELGLDSGRYGIDQLQQDTALDERLRRGERYTVGKRYLAAGATMELTPLWLMTGNSFVNLDDGSALLQWTHQYSLSQDSNATVSLALPVGRRGEEFRGIPLNSSEPGGLHIGGSTSLYIQLAWYF